MHATTEEQLKTWKSQDQAIDNYIASFSADQMKKLREKLISHIKTQNVFLFGPKGDKMYCQIHSDNCVPADKTLGVHIWIGSKPNSLVKLYPIFLGSTNLNERAEILLKVLLGMVALWDITMKDYFNALGRAEGMDI